jgi:hypothetical protein
MRGKPFEPGNKAGKGRPTGSRNQKSIYEETLAEFGVPIIKKGALMALNGDRSLLRVCIERLIPPAQPPPTRFRLPKNEGELDMEKILKSILKQTSTGRISPQQAAEFGTLAEIYMRTVGEVKYEERLAALEAVEEHNSEEKAS